MKRVQINSTTSRVNIYKSYPTIDVAKTYILKIEQFTVPANTNARIKLKLFDIERRGDYGEILLALDGTTNPQFRLPVDGFTPDHCRTVQDLIFQINVYVREILCKIATQYFEVANDIDGVADVELIHNS